MKPSKSDVHREMMYKVQYKSQVEQNNFESPKLKNMCK